MKCSKVQKLLSDWHNGELSPALDAAMAEHVDSCGPCREIAAAYDEMMTMLGEAEPPELPADFAATAHQRLVAEGTRQEPATASRWGRWLPSLVRGGAMVGVGALAVIAVMWWRGDTDRPAPATCETVATAEPADANLALGEIAMVTLTLDLDLDQEVEVEVVLPDGLALLGENYDALPEKTVSFTTTHRGEPIRLPVRAERPGNWVLVAHARADGRELTSETRLQVPPA